MNGMIDETLLQSVLDAIPDALLLVSPERVVIRANRGAKAWFGDDCVGRALIDLLDDPLVIRALDDLKDSPQSVEITLPGAVPHVFSVAVAPVDDGGAALVLHDLTEIRRSEQLRVDFVANASHEIRSPLATIVGMIETIRGPAKDDREACDKFLDVMAGEAKRMTRLVEDLLSLSKIEVREHSKPTDYVVIPAIIEEVAGTLAHMAAERDMTIDLKIQDNLPPTLGNADELAMMIRNLISNGLSYGREGTVVRVSVTHRENIVSIIIADESEGIPAEDIPRLTERFYRVDKGRSRKMGGTGLGLAIVKHVVNRHRGSLTIESTMGEGSRVTVQIPAETVPAFALKQ